MLQVLYNNVTIVNMTTACMYLLRLCINQPAVSRQTGAYSDSEMALFCTQHDVCTLQDHDSFSWFIAHRSMFCESQLN